jgi:hypothetical protein
MQFIKLRSPICCCRAQIDREVSIFEWCVMDTDALWEKIYNELDIDQYLPECISKDKINEVKKIIFNEGVVREKCEKSCYIQYLFNPVGKKFEGLYNVNGRYVRTVEEIIASINLSEDEE